MDGDGLSGGDGSGTGRVWSGGDDDAPDHSATHDSAPDNSTAHDNATRARKATVWRNECRLVGL
jgi:hypothetical protein